MKRTLIAILLALALVLIPVSSAFAGNPEGVTITATPGEYVSISHTTAAWDIGTVAVNTDYWWFGGLTPPTGWPLDPLECADTITNDGNVTVGITITGANFTGGAGWTLAAAPGRDIVQLTAWKSGDLEAAGIDLLDATPNPGFITGLAVDGTKEWEMRLSTGTFSDQALKTGSVTLTAVP